MKIFFKFKVFLFFSFLILALFFSAVSSYASFLPAKYGGSAPSASVYTGSDPSVLSGCAAAGTFCWNSESVGVTDCGSGNACSGGSPWTKYQYDACYVISVDAFGLPVDFQAYYTQAGTVYSTADKCIPSDGPYIRSGHCDGSTGSVYKVCCNNSGGGVSAGACVQIPSYAGAPYPPYDGICPDGSYMTSPGVTTCPPSLPGPPSNTSFGSPSCNGTSAAMTFSYSAGSNATYHELRYSLDNAALNLSTTFTSNPMPITTFSADHTLYYNVYACNGSGCTPDPNGYYYITLPACSGGGPTNTPTPVPPTSNPNFCNGVCTDSGGSGYGGTACTTSGGQAGTWQWNNVMASSQVYSNCPPPNTYCYYCQAASGPTPTTSVGCRTQGQSCSPSCCTPLVCSGGTCQPPPPPPTAPPSCRNFNQSCGVGANCCSPLVCTGGACAVATPTPVPHVTIQGHFVDSNGNDLTLNIGQGVTLRQNSTGSTFAPSGISNSIFWSNFLTPGTYTVTANVPANYIVTSSTAINGTSHLPGSYVSTNPVTVNLPSNGNYADIFFRYALRTCTTTFSGNVVVDPTTNNCSSLATLGGSLYSGFGQVTAYNGTVPAASQVNVSAGSYAGLSYSPICGTPSTITISGTLYPVIGICDDGTYHAQTSYTYPYTNTNSPSVARNVTFLLTSQGPWYQVDSGDVRFPNLTNKVPRGQNASLNGTSLFASSTGNVTLGAGNFPLTTNWQVNQEYAYNSDFENGLGSMSYTFYMNRAKQRQLLPNNNNLSTTVNLDLGTLGSGVYQTDGDLSIKASTISSSCAAGGKHIVILVKGTATVNGNISVAAGQCNLFVLAAKTGLVFANTVGTNSLSSTTSNADGYYTSEGNITLNGGNVCPTPDLRLNVGGALIANSIHPFAKNASGGKIIVNRNLCGSNLTNPAYYVSPRPDFLLQMTDFYKISYKTVKEVEP